LIAVAGQWPVPVAIVADQVGQHPGVPGIGLAAGR
jgi:hypothetical protein